MTKPHVCPACQGKSVTCSTCKGTHVVWEPEDPQESTPPPVDVLEIDGL